MIHWFPGHMAKANRDILKMQKLADIFLVILDGRAPISGYNKAIEELSPNTPRLFIISKCDLADPKQKQKVKKYFASKGVNIIFCSLKSKKFIPTIITEINSCLASLRIRNMQRKIYRKIFRVFILGPPNSGKSTLINLLAKKKVVQTANKPGITRHTNWINLKNFQLLDTPGILATKLESDFIGIKLAMIESIDLNIVNITNFTYECLKIVSKYYPKKLLEISITPVNDNNSAHNEIVKFAKRNNWLLKENKPNLNKSMRYIIKYIQNLQGVTYD